MVEAKKAALIAVPCVAGVGAGLFYFLKSRQKVITATIDPPEGRFCETWYTVMVKITDGFGNPLANQPFKVRTYLDGIMVGETDNIAGTPCVTDSSGTFMWLMGWESAEGAPMEHQEVDESHVFFIEVIADGAIGKSNEAIFTIVACTDKPCKLPPPS